MTDETVPPKEDLSPEEVFNRIVTSLETFLKSETRHDLRLGSPELMKIGETLSEAYTYIDRVPDGEARYDRLDELMRSYVRELWQRETNKAQ